MYQRILVAIDTSGSSKRSLEEAIRMARVGGASLRLVHVVNEIVLEPGYLPMTSFGEALEALREGGRRILRDAEAVVRREGLTCETVLIETMGGHAAHSILKQAREWGADLIVMGTHGRRGLSRLVLGSDAEIVLRHATLPLLLVRDAPEEIALRS